MEECDICHNECEDAVSLTCSECKEMWGKITCPFCTRTVLYAVLLESANSQTIITMYVKRESILITDLYRVVRIEYV